MSLLPVPVDNRGLDWPRKVANAINAALAYIGRRSDYPFTPLDADPANPGEGQTYFNTSTNKVRTYANGTWNDLF